MSTKPLNKSEVEKIFAEATDRVGLFSRLFGLVYPGRTEQSQLVAAPKVSRMTWSLIHVMAVNFDRRTDPKGTGAPGAYWLQYGFEPVEGMPDWMIEIAD